MASFIYEEEYDRILHGLSDSVVKAFVRRVRQIHELGGDELMDITPKQMLTIVIELDKMPDEERTGMYTALPIIKQWLKSPSGPAN